MAEIELIQTSTTSKKHVRQPPSVPFLWEVKPGIAKKDWKPEFPLVSSVPIFRPPVKLIASVPFKWEEKPVTPFPSFLQSSQVSATAHLPLPLTDGYSDEHVDVYEDSDQDSSSNEGEGEEEEEQQQSMYKSDLETFGSETDDSYGSASSHLANCLASSAAISTAVPALNTSLTEDNSGLLESPSSPSSETESSTSLFPLFPPKSGFLEKVGNSDAPLTPPPQRWNQNCDHESTGNIIARRPPTLGELIMMSRRRSYRRRAAQMRKQNLSMDFIKERALGCCIFANGSKMLDGLYSKRKQLPRLKLMW